MLLSLFCYEPPALGALLRQLAGSGLHGKPVHMLVAAGRAQLAVQAALNSENLFFDESNGLQRSADGRHQLSISYLPLLTQTDFDHLLWACDVNFVRGEDSIVRALWSGKAFIWQIYPQDDGAHRAKLDAFLDMLGAAPSLRAFHHAWNAGHQPLQSPPSGSETLSLEDAPDWQKTALRARARLQAQDDLTSKLMQFVLKNR